MPADPALRARVGRVVVVRLLGCPGPDRVARGPPLPAAPENVLPELEPPLGEGVRQLAVRPPLPGPPPGVVLQARVPHQRGLPLGGPDQVVLEQELYGVSQAVPAQLFGEVVDCCLVDYCIITLVRVFWHGGGWW
ncbi:unnamed protein product [Cuscuta campestris]|uniref:Uncharacterized protein n=1 Tax=Cuscuta campestris TaxID=132261 RepID=A0A484KL86_9ASTE|nr:unnamed protein product [Cuscuta campestris]